MAKTIKFNLICDGTPIRNLEDLQNNFSIEDVLEYYNNTLLHRWLKVRGYERELEAVEAIKCSAPIEIIKSLIAIFGVDIDEKSVAEKIYMLDYVESRKKLYHVYEQENFKVESIINHYRTGYTKLIDSIIENPDNISLIKASINEIVEKYFWVFELNHRNLFYIFLQKAPLAIFALLSHERTREYFLPLRTSEGVSVSLRESTTATSLWLETNACESTTCTSGTGTPLSLDPSKYDKSKMYKKICELISKEKLSEILKDNLKSCCDTTDDYWKDIETGEKKYMILSMESGDYIRPAGEKGGDLNHDDIKDKFVIIDGIDYKSNNAWKELLYMEV